MTKTLITLAEAREKYNRHRLPSPGYRPRARDIYIGWSPTDEVAFREDGSGPEPLMLMVFGDYAARLIIVQEVHFQDEQAEVEERCQAMIKRWRRHGGPRSIAVKLSLEEYRRELEEHRQETEDAPF